MNQEKNNQGLFSEKEAEHLEMLYYSLKGRISEVLEKTDVLEQENSSLTEKVTALEGQKNALIEKLNTLITQNTDLARKVNSLAGKSARNGIPKEVLEKMEALEQKNTSLTKKVNALERQNADLTKKVNSLTAKPAVNAVPKQVQDSFVPPQIPEADVNDASDFSYVKDGKTIAITGYAGFEQETVVIPDTIDGLPVTVIGNNAFENCKFIKKVYFPQGLKEIGWYAFCGCSSLEAVQLPEGLKRIGMEAFAFSGLKRIYIPKSVTDIYYSENYNNNPFFECKALVIYANPGAYAIAWARQHGFTVKPAQEFKQP